MGVSCSGSDYHSGSKFWKLDKGGEYNIKRQAFTIDDFVDEQPSYFKSEELLKDFEKYDEFKNEGTLKIYGNNKRDQKFLMKAHRLQFPLVQKLGLYHINLLYNHRFLTNFLCNSLNYTINNFYVSSNDWSSPADYFFPIVKVLPIVTDEIVLDGFHLDDVMLSTIIEKSHKVKSLGLVNLYLDITESFSIKDTAPFEIENLYMDQTGVQHDKKSLNQDKTRVFFEAVAKTSLAKSLKTVSVQKGDFNEGVLKAILKDCGINAQVIVNIDGQKSKFQGFKEKVKHLLGIRK